MWLGNVLAGVLLAFAPGGAPAEDRAAAPGPGADVLPAELSDGSDFSKQLSDARVFAEREKEMRDLSAPVKPGTGTPVVGFARKALDGSTLRLEKELRTTADEVLERHSLVKESGAERQVVWETEVRHARGARQGLGPSGTFRDAVAVGDKIYVFYYRHPANRVDAMAKGQGSKWVKVASLGLSGMGLGRGLGRFFRDPESGQLGLIYKASPDREERWVGLDQVHAVEMAGKERQAGQPAPAEATKGEHARGGSSGSEARK